MRFLWLVVFVLFCMGQVAMADVSLKLPDGMGIVAVNGYNSDHFDEVSLSGGRNQIAIRFEKDFSRGFDDGAIEKSDVFVLRFDYANGILVMGMPDIKRVSQLKRFNRDPRITLTDGNGQPVEFAIDKLKKEGVVLLRNYAEELRKFNGTESPAAVKNGKSHVRQYEPVFPHEHKIKQRKDTGAQSTAESLSESSKESGKRAKAETPDAPDEQNQMAEIMLKYWYQQADDETRRRFIQWLNR